MRVLGTFLIHKLVISCIMFILILIKSLRLNLFFQELFYCHGIRKLCVSDNELTKIPPAIASLNNLEHLDFSKNGMYCAHCNSQHIEVVCSFVNPQWHFTLCITTALQLFY